jgi:hypothetical protein
MSALVLAYRGTTATGRTAEERRLLRAFEACDPIRRESLLYLADVFARNSARGRKRRTRPNVGKPAITIDPDNREGA